MYRPDPAPIAPTIENLVEAVWRELNRIGSEVTMEPDFLQLVEYNAAPTKPRNWMVVAADGTNWNPGSGKGVYVYYNAGWHFLG